jgi:hypothetical protein
MKTRAAGVMLLILACLAAAFSRAEGQYTKIGDIHIGGSGSFDYLTVDSAARRLYVTHGTEIVVIDTSTQAIVGRIADTPRVHGIAIAPGGRGFTSNGGENKVGIVDLKTLQTLSKVETGLNPDAILYEPTREEIYALNHTGKSVTVINASSGTVTATIALGGQAETGQADSALGRVFVNIEDKNSVDVIDVASHTVVATWPVTPAESPTGMAIDTASHRLFVGGGPSLVMMDARSGKVIASASICKGTDATVYDAATKTAFSSCGDGHITVVQVNGDRLEVIQTIETTRGARTMAFDPATRRIYTAAQNFAPVDPSASTATTDAGGRGPAPIPDSFHVLVFGIR